jgi:hypothetical protein
MTHQPPIPDAATSPYPLHPEPLSEEQRAATAAAEAKEEAARSSAEGSLSATVIGVGAALGIGAAAVGGLLYARRSRKTAPKAAAAKRTGSKRKSGDDKTRRDAGDRSRVAAGEAYEVSYFARKHKISAAEAREIIREAGPDRDAANALAARRSKRSH